MFHVRRANHTHRCMKHTKRAGLRASLAGNCVNSRGRGRSESAGFEYLDHMNDLQQSVREVATNATCTGASFFLLALQLRCDTGICFVCISPVSCTEVYTLEELPELIQASSHLQVVARLSPGNPKLGLRRHPACRQRREVTLVIPAFLCFAQYEALRSPYCEGEFGLRAGRNRSVRSVGGGRKRSF